MSKHSKIEQPTPQQFFMDVKNNYGILGKKITNSDIDSKLTEVIAKQQDRSHTYILQSNVKVKNNNTGDISDLIINNKNNTVIKQKYQSQLKSIT